METKLIHLISGPRNISTALMYSFGNRKDCSIVDEPMYGVYLQNHDVDHPGRNEVLIRMPLVMDDVIKSVFKAKYDTPYVFVKNMAHHFIGVDHDFIKNYQSVFLIRDPKEIIISFSKVIPIPTMQDIGLEYEYFLYQFMKSNSVFEPIVLDSNEVLKSPEKVLSKLCQQLDIPFDRDMLSWSPGPRKEDGIWAKYWYANVHRSTTFKKPRRTDSASLIEELEPLYQRCLTIYNKLYPLSIKA